MEKFKEFDIKDFQEKIFTLIKDKWMLITAGKEEDCNTMTASWGGFGILWNKPVAFIFIRPQRYTLNFIDREQELTLSFFPDEYHQALSYCGAHSGKDEEKIKNAHLNMEFTPSCNPTFKEAKLVIECKKLYKQPMDPKAFLDTSLIDKWYPERDYHNMFVVEIEKIWVKE